MSHRTHQATRPLTPAEKARIDRMTPRPRRAGHIALITDRTTVGDVDLIAVERLVNGSLDWSLATRAERQAAYLIKARVRTTNPERRAA